VVLFQLVVFELSDCKLRAHGNVVVLETKT